MTHFLGRPLVDIHAGVTFRGAMGATEANRVLFVDDDRSTCALVQQGLRPYGYRVDLAGAMDDAVALLDEQRYDVLICDLDLGDGPSGIELAEHAALHHPDVPTLIVTGHGTYDAAIAALRVRVEDFIAKPIQLERLAAAVSDAATRPRLARVVEGQTGSSEHTRLLIGSSDPMRKLTNFVARVARSDTSTFIHGESGTGKEVVARMLHEQSRRASGPFVAINCAAIPANLLESELFGHVRGAFTGASRETKGLFQQADGGTLLLDEIGDLPLELQPKLLRALEERKVRKVGGSQPLDFDARLVTATHRDLHLLVEQGKFREDLFYRINVVTVDVPPLRDRGDDVLELALHFVERFAKKHGKVVNGIDPGAAARLVAYRWPGNVRELENAVEQAVALTHFDRIATCDLPRRIRSESTSSVAAVPAEIPTLEELERKHIVEVLGRTRGNKSRAARLLGIDRRTLHRKLDRVNESNH
jgi:DNA-binding NtrC family response regulator